MNEPEHKPKIDHKTNVDIGLGISLSEWLISGVMGITSGMVAAGATIRDRFTDEVREWPGFKQLYKQHGHDLDAVNVKHKALKSDWTVLRDDISNIKDEFGKTVEETLLKDHGIVTGGWRGLTLGTWQRYGFAGTSSQGRIAFNTVVGATVGAAATLSFFNGVASRHKIEQIADATSEKTR